MYYSYDHYFQQLEQRLLQLEQRLLQLEEENHHLKTELQQIKPLHIENINYKIQELVVKELKGTLNIGMTALSDAEEIKKWMSATEEQEEDIQLNDLDHPEQEKAPIDEQLY